MASTALQLTLQPATVPPGPRRPARPALRVLEGGRAPSRLARQAVYRRRRLMAAVALVAAVAITFVLVSSALTRTAGGEASSSAAGAPSPTGTVVVQPGDTLWTIAAAAAPAVDVRITVDQLVALNGRAPLAVGQELVLP